MDGESPLVGVRAPASSWLDPEWVPLIVPGAPRGSWLPCAVIGFAVAVGAWSFSAVAPLCRWYPLWVAARCRGWSFAIGSGSPCCRVWSPVVIGGSLLLWVVPRCWRWLSLTGGHSVIAVGSLSLVVVPLYRGARRRLSSPVVVPRCQGWCPVVVVGSPLSVVALLGWW